MMVCTSQALILTIGHESGFIFHLVVIVLRRKKYEHLDGRLSSSVNPLVVIFQATVFGVKAAKPTAWKDQSSDPIFSGSFKAEK